MMDRQNGYRQNGCKFLMRELFRVVTASQNDSPRVVPECSMPQNDSPRVVPECNMPQDDSPRVVPECSMSKDDSPRVVPECSMPQDDSTRIVPECSMPQDDSTLVRNKRSFIIEPDYDDSIPISVLKKLIGE